jgi:hypothetical protein
MTTASPTPDPSLDPSSLERLKAAQKTVRQAQLEQARALERLEATRHWVAAGFASLAEMCSRLGLSGAETATLLRTGQAVAARPELAKDLLEGRLSLEAVAALRDVALDPSLQQPGEDLFALAVEVPARHLARVIRRRVAERREGGPVVEVTVHLSGKDRDNLERARILASRKATRVLSLSETVRHVTLHFLDAVDPRRVTPGRRRMADTRQLPGRPVPAEVDRALDVRFGGRCAVPHCPHIVWVHRAHLLAKRKGGSQEADNLILLCPRHHRMLDRGQMSIVGPCGARRFVTRGGLDLGPLDKPKGGPEPPERGPAASSAPG